MAPRPVRPPGGPGCGGGGGDGGLFSRRSPMGTVPGGVRGLPPGRPAPHRPGAGPAGGDGRAAVGRAVGARRNPGGGFGGYEP
ncbi:hypothetical protein B5F22_01840 [Pseudoflavonifractor sp. An187]|nr:hypothetical protein B5F22_01840 [Pseudoflavonifractor sp. An187]